MKFAHVLIALLAVSMLAPIADAGYRSREIKIKKGGSPVYVKSRFRGNPPKAPAKLYVVRPRPVVLVPPVKTSEKPAVKVEVKVSPQPN